MKLLYLIVLLFVILCFVDLGEAYPPFMGTVPVFPASLPPGQSRTEMNAICATVCFGGVLGINKAAHYDVISENCVCRTISGPIERVRDVSRDSKLFGVFRRRVQECLNGTWSKTSLEYNVSTKRFTCKNGFGRIIFDKYRNDDRR